MLFTIKRVKLIEKKKFIITTLNLDYKVFVVYIATFNISFDLDTKVFSLKKAQITYLKVDNVSIKFSDKYIDFENIFF